MAGTSETNWVVEVGELLRRDGLRMALETPTSIFKLPDSVTKENPQAYSPSRLLLGPFHELSHELHKMEIFKLEQAKVTKERFQLPELTLMVDQLKELEVPIRASYGANLAIGSDALASRILIDGLFLIWLLQIYADEKNYPGILQGLSTEDELGPKIRPKGVVDGQQVNIPVLPLVGPEGRRRLGSSDRLHNRRYKLELPVFDEQELYLKLEGNMATMTRNEILKDLLKLENQIPIQVLKRVLPKDLIENLPILFYKFCVFVSPLSLPSADKFTTSNDNPFLNLSEILDQSQHLLHFLYALLYYQRFLAYRPSQDYRSGSLFVELLNLLAKVVQVGIVQQLVEAVGLIQSLIGMLGKIHHSSPFETETSPGLPSATKLRKVGVKFHGGDGGGFDDESATLTLPSVTINDFYEVILRNLVAFEVEAKMNPSSLSHYVTLMNGLIATTKDVGILKRAGIIVGGRSGDEDDVVKLFKDLGNVVVKGGFDSEEGRSNFESFMNFEGRIGEEIMKYYESRWMVKAERFVKRYIFPVLQGLMILVVVVLILIVAIRTVCAIFDDIPVYTKKELVDSEHLRGVLMDFCNAYTFNQGGQALRLDTNMGTKFQEHKERLVTAPVVIVPDESDNLVTCRANVVVDALSRKTAHTSVMINKQEKLPDEMKNAEIEVVARGGTAQIA
ncbi:putative UPF0481 protein At3g02645 [Cucurbita pepo subsp. pepo]|uniref:putative UPF0481 protein At3g02645 n=1 Tax=Cucurbita pepo subsp. pepo TaxID=3664 RepID=UPI000C9D8F67|nr:putative UPF0481 protein At3g02645 [Cucurbita pepo subsp. pepo]